MKLLTLTALIPVAVSAFEPTSNYIDDVFYGWNVKLHKDTPSITRDVLKVKLAELRDRSAQLPTLQRQLTASVNRLNPTIWLDNDGNDCTSGAVFHPSVEWLTANGRNPEKAKGIVVNGPVLSDYLVGQPLMLQHELAHAFENNINYPANVQIAYEAAKASKAYVGSIQKNIVWNPEVTIRDADRTSSSTSEAYAMNNRNEYFAECTEAFLGINDFFPYTGAQLSQVDLGGYNMVIATYGLPTTFTPRTPVVTTDVDWQSPVKIRFVNRDAYCTLDVKLVNSNGIEEHVCTIKAGKDCLKSDAKYSQVFLMRRADGSLQTGYTARQMDVNFEFSCDALDDCRDSNPNCQLWSTQDQCRQNPAYMLPNCKLSCNQCTPFVTTTVAPSQATNAPPTDPPTTKATSTSTAATSEGIKSEAPPSSNDDKAGGTGASSLQTFFANKDNVTIVAVAGGALVVIIIVILVACYLKRKVGGVSRV